MSAKQIGPEQQEKLKKLERDFSIKMGVEAIKSVFLLVLANFFVALINVFYVHNPAFSISGSLLSFVLIFSTFNNNLKVEHDKLREEALKILTE